MNMKMYKNAIIKISWWGIIIVAAILVFAAAKTNVSGEDNIQNTKRAYYREMEKTYEKVLRDVLDRKGYSNAGITITSVISVDGTREVSVAIHHRKISEYTQEEQLEFLEGMKELGFTDDETQINYSII